MTIHIPEWLLWSVGTVVALVVLALAVFALIVVRGLRGPFWR